MKTKEKILAIEEANKDRVFLIDNNSGSSITFAQLKEEALKVSGYFLEKGLVRGDRVGFLIPNSIECAILYFSCFYAGLVSVPINANLSRREIASILRQSLPKVLMISSTMDEIASFIKELDLGIEIISVPTASVCGSNRPDISSFKTTSSLVAFEGVSEDDIMLIAYTSGTTALPKGITHRISDIIGNGLLFSEEMGLGVNNRFYNLLSMGYLGGIYNLLFIPYVCGASVVITDSFNAKNALCFWESIIKHQVNTLWLVPTIIATLLAVDRDEEGKRYCRDNIKFVIAGTAPLSAVVRKQFEEDYGTPVYENYGLSETLFISTNSFRLPVVDTCVGKILPQVEVEIRDDDSKPIAFGEDGEIFVRTSFLMPGCLIAPEKEIVTFKRGEWFATGDVGKREEDNLFITGRKKDIIIRGGVNISPSAIEEVIYEHSGVLKCAVVGLPHHLYGEDIMVVIKLKPDYDFQEVRTDLIKQCKSTLSVVQQPAQYFQIEEFPLSSAGKMQKNKIREILSRKLGIDREI
jgi:acyl-CoA synthetase (AMP-forming)/AMP-acid ligase II